MATIPGINIPNTPAAVLPDPNHPFTLDIPNLRTEGVSALGKIFKMPNIPGVNLPDIGAILGMGSTANTANSWLTAMARRGDPLLNIDWLVSMQYPGGQPFNPEYIEEIQMPITKIDADQIFRGGQHLYFAKSKDIGQATVKMYEDIKFTSIAYIGTWKGQVVNNQGIYGVPASYKGTITITPTDATGAALGRFTLHGVWPTDTDTLSFISGTAERIVITQTFSVDSLSFVYLSNS